jgi:hypothetical protein
MVNYKLQNSLSTGVCHGNDGHIELNGLLFFKIRISKAEGKITTLPSTISSTQN